MPNVEIIEPRGWRITRAAPANTNDCQTAPQPDLPTVCPLTSAHGKSTTIPPVRCAPGSNHAAQARFFPGLRHPTIQPPAAAARPAARAGPGIAGGPAARPVRTRHRASGLVQQTVQIPMAKAFPRAPAVARQRGHRRMTHRPRRRTTRHHTRNVRPQPPGACAIHESLPHALCRRP